MDACYAIDEAIDEIVEEAGGVEKLGSGMKDVKLFRQASSGFASTYSWFNYLLDPIRNKFKNTDINGFTRVYGSKEVWVEGPMIFLNMDTATELRRLK